MGIEVSDPFTATEASIGSVAFAKPSRRFAAKADSFVIADRALGGENSSKISSFLRPLRFETFPISKMKLKPSYFSTDPTSRLLNVCAYQHNKPHTCKI